MKWQWVGLSRDGKPVLYERGPSQRRLVRGERDMSEADARLIAVAWAIPELIEALTAAIQYIDANDMSGEMAPWVAEIAALIGRIERE